MQTALDFKPHEKMKKIYKRGLQLNKYGAQLHIELAARRECMI